MTLSFLSTAAAPDAPIARSPLADAAGAIEVREGWEIAAPFGDPEAVEVADASALGKLEVTGPAGPLGTAVRRERHWWCPVTPDRALALCATTATADLRRRLDGLDLTAAYGALRLTGPLARETFARFCALDLRDDATPVGGFRPGSVARTPGFVLRDGEESWTVLFGAAYGRYLWETVTDAAAHVARTVARPRRERAHA